MDHYLASPQYGVRWARWWLDLARYGESNGFEFDEFRPNAWRYRDWVIDPSIAICHTTNSRGFNSRAT